MTRYEFIFSNRPRYRLKRHFLFWFVFILHILVFRYYLYDLQYLGYLSTYMIRLKNMLLFLPVAFFYAYFAIYYLLPNYILKGRYFQLFLIVFSSSMIFLLISFSISQLLNIRLAWDIPLEREPLVRRLDFTVSNGLVYPLTVSTFAIGIKMAKNFYLQQIENERLVRLRIEQELQLLKSQIHPRFLFQSLDTIYQDSRSGFLHSSSMLLRLSDLLSYLLYEYDIPLVPLHKELAMIENYLALGAANYREKLQITINNSCNESTLHIAPLVLLPVLETTLNEKKMAELLQLQLDLTMMINQGAFHFRLSSQTRQLSIASETENWSAVRRRLEEQYPGTFEMKYENVANELVLEIVIPLSASADHRNIPAQIQEESI